MMVAMPRTTSGEADTRIPSVRPLGGTTRDRHSNNNWLQKFIPNVPYSARGMVKTRAGMAEIKADPSLTCAPVDSTRCWTPFPRPKQQRAPCTTAVLPKATRSDRWGQRACRGDGPRCQDCLRDLFPQQYLPDRCPPSALAVTLHTALVAVCCVTITVLPPL